MAVKEDQDYTWNAFSVEWRCNHCSFTVPDTGDESEIQKHCKIHESEVRDPKVVTIGSKLGSFKVSRIHTPIPADTTRMAYTCRCGCQIFMIYSDGYARCMACDHERSTLEVFN